MRTGNMNNELLEDLLSIRIWCKIKKGNIWEFDGSEYPV